MVGKKKTKLSNDSKKGAASETPPETQLQSAGAVKRFNVAAKSFTDKATRSKAEAQKVLVRLGIRTPSGQLSKRYK